MEPQKETTFEKIVRKGKATTFEKSDMPPLFSDTICNKYGGATSWEAVSNLLEGEKLRPLETKVTTNAEESYEASYFEAACSFLH